MNNITESFDFQEIFDTANNPKYKKTRAFNGNTC